MKHITINNRVISPSKIVCVGRNYAEHARELENEIPDEPVFFFKPNSALSDTLCAVHGGEQLHYEGEICFVYERQSLSAVGFGLDLTKRELQSKLKGKGLPWERAKAFDGAALFGKFVEIEDLSSGLSLELSVNDRLVQDGGISLMLFKPLKILEHLSRFVTLEDGDVIMTGTPKGVGCIKPGDVLSGRIMDGTRCLTSARWQAV